MKDRSFLKKLKQILKFRRISEIQLLKQKYVDLGTTYEKIKLNEVKSKNFTKVTSKIDDLFSSRKDWDKANEIEQYLVAMFDEAELDVEFKVKLLDAKRKLGEDTWKFYEAEFLPFWLFGLLFRVFRKVGSGSAHQNGTKVNQE